MGTIALMRQMNCHGHQVANVGVMIITIVRKGRELKSLPRRGSPTAWVIQNSTGDVFNSYDIIDRGCPI